MASLPPSMSVDAREATLAAVLVGTVVIILGYASGLGLQVPLVQTASVQPPVTAATAPVERTVRTPGASLLPAVPFAPSAVVAPSVPVQTYPPRSSPTSTPTTPTTPTPEPSCSAGLLGGLLDPVTDLLDPLLGGLLDPLLGTTCSVAPSPLQDGEGAR